MPNHKEQDMQESVDKQIEEVMGLATAFALWQADGREAAALDSFDERAASFYNEAKGAKMELEKKLRTLLSSAQSGEQAPVAEIVSASHDSAEFGERAVNFLRDFNHLEYGTKLYTHPAPALEVELREVLSKLESACEKRAALMSQDVYNAMADLPGMSVALVELDVARMQARRAISASQPNGEAK